MGMDKVSGPRDTASSFDLESRLAVCISFKLCRLQV